MSTTNIEPRSRLMRSISKYILTLVFIIMCFSNMITDAKTNDNDRLIENLVTQFYKTRNGKLFWFTNEEGAYLLRQELITQIEQCDLKGLDKGKYDLTNLKGRLFLNDSSWNSRQTADKLYTHEALKLIEEYLSTCESPNKFSYDELSPKYTERDNKLKLDLLSNSSDFRKLQYNLTTLLPNSIVYSNLLNALSLKSTMSENEDTVKQLRDALSNYRWIFHFHLPKYIVVNIASATLNYFENDSLLLSMKVVAGKPSTPTPRFVSYCDKLILYPYWNVPQSIAIHEILPACKKAVGILKFLNLQVMDSKGRIVDPKSIDWKKLTAKNLPYHFRQSTGCDNALGVMKFNLTDPYSVYLHDTNAKYAFGNSKRYLSHGCIRIEQPIALANLISEHTIDSIFLQKCIRNQQPVTQSIASPVAVFVIYQTVDANADQVKFYEDIYNLN